MENKKFQYDSVLIAEIFKNIPANVTFYAKYDFEKEKYAWIKISNNSAQTVNRQEVIIKFFDPTELVFLEKAKICSEK